MRKKVSVEATWVIDDGIYIPEKYQPSDEELEEIDDDPNHILEIALDNMVRDSLEQLGAKALRSTIWLEDQ